MWTRVNAAVGRLHPWRLSRVCCGPGNESRRGRWLRAVALAPSGVRLPSRACRCRLAAVRGHGAAAQKSRLGWGSEVSPSGR